MTQILQIEEDPIWGGFAAKSATNCPNQELLQRRYKNTMIEL